MQLCLKKLATFVFVINCCDSSDMWHVTSDMWPCDKHVGQNLLEQRAPCRPYPTVVAITSLIQDSDLVVTISYNFSKFQHDRFLALDILTMECYNTHWVEKLSFSLCVTLLLLSWSKYPISLLTQERGKKEIYYKKGALNSYSFKQKHNYGSYL